MIPIALIWSVLFIFHHKSAIQRVGQRLKHPLIQRPTAYAFCKVGHTISAVKS